MSSWLSYTVGPRDRDSLLALRDLPAETIPDEVVAASRSKHADVLTPRVRTNFGVLSKKTSADPDVGVATLGAEILDWLQGYTNRIAVVYLVRASDTSDTAHIEVYCPDDRGLFELVETCQGAIRRDRHRLRPGDYLTESALSVVPPGHDPTPGDDGDLLYTLTARYGCRPVHYMGELQNW